MQKNFKLVVDTFSDVTDLIGSWADAEFWDFGQHVANGKLEPGAVYIIGREQFTLNAPTIIDLINRNVIRVVFSNPAEGSETQLRHCEQLGIVELIKQNRMLIITGGDAPSDWAALFYENFLPKMLDYKENSKAVENYQSNYSLNRPYKFLFLNGRSRRHRQQLLTRLQPVLDQALWTNLDSNMGPIKLLPEHYEFEQFSTKNIAIDKGFVKHQLFGKHSWGDVYLQAEPYLDTYFSLVTETVFDYPCSFRTEKIWKPMVIGHPWIAVANSGFYRDIKNIGFRTFESVIDESFDQIDNNQDRLERIAVIVEDLCQQDLAKFLQECYTVCKYNQQHLEHLRGQVRKEFPNRLLNFLTQYNFNE